MKANQHVSKAAVCPFYHKHDGISIYCDGMCEGSLSSKESFRTSAEMKAYMKSHCEWNWRTCEKTLGRITKNDED